MALVPHFRWAVAAGVLVAIDARSAAYGQGRPAGDSVGVTACADSLGRNAADTADSYVVATLRAFDPDQRVPRTVLDLALYEIASRFRAPTPLALRAYGGGGDLRMPGTARPSGHLVVSGTYGLALGRDSRVTDQRVLASALNRRLDQAILDAIRAADSARMLPLLPDDVRGRKAELRLRLTTDSLPPRDSGLVLFRLRTPVVHFSSLVTPLKGNRVPTYPAAARAAAVDGEVLVQFAVSPEGRVETPTVNVLRATHIEFVQAVLEVLPSMRFQPARVDNCPVAQLVQMPFEFRVLR